MSDLQAKVERRVISEEVMVATLNRCDETRQFMINMWLENPTLAKQGGAKVAQLLSPAPIQRAAAA